MLIKKLAFSALLLTIFGNLYSQYWLYETVYFDTVFQFSHSKECLVIDTSSQNIWQRAIPSKTFLNSAYSDDRAMITDSIHPYPPDNHSWFEIILDDLPLTWFNLEEYPMDVFVEMKHKFDTDSLKDGGYITVSYDSGQTWMNIIDDSIYPGATPEWRNERLYTRDQTLFNGEKGFSGHSDGWVSTWFAWHYVLAKKSTSSEHKNSMIIRFNFISDSEDTSKDGWMIDDIRIFSIDLGSGIENHNPGDDIMIFPNPVKNRFVIDLKQVRREIDLTMTGINGQVYFNRQYRAIDRISLDTKGLNSGMYFIHLTIDGSLNVTKKLIVY